MGWAHKRQLAVTAWKHCCRYHKRWLYLPIPLYASWRRDSSGGVRVIHNIGPAENPKIPPYQPLFVCTYCQFILGIFPRVRYPPWAQVKVASFIEGERLGRRTSYNMTESLSISLFIANISRRPWSFLWIISNMSRSVLSMLIHIIAIIPTQQSA